MLARVLEPEVMDSAGEARDYDAMDHRAVNAQFVDDLLPRMGTVRSVLDAGTGTAQIPIEFCRRDPDINVVAVDAARHMLELGQANVARVGLAQRIRLELCDAKRLPFATGSFDAVVSNSIVHHIPHPTDVLTEMVRVVMPGGLLFVRDLVRPADEATLEQLVAQYAGDANDHQRRMFADSLRAALTVEEVRALVTGLGFDPEGVALTSDRHWTWVAVKPPVSHRLQ